MGWWVEKKQGNPKLKHYLEDQFLDQFQTPKYVLFLKLPTTLIMGTSTGLAFKMKLGLLKISVWICTLEFVPLKEQGIPRTTRTAKNMEPWSWDQRHNPVAQKKVLAK